MATKDYIEKANNLLKANELAIEVVKECPPKGVNSDNLKMFMNHHLSIKESLLSPDPKFMNVASLKYQIQDVFTYFNEGSGPTVELFWKRIKQENLPYERENKLAKILAKKKIRNRVEYDYVIDTMVSFKQEQLITEQEFQLLSEWVGDFEKKQGKG